MKILSWNVNGIRAGHRKGFLEWLQNEQPDIIGIQETKALEEQLPPELAHPEGYHAYWHLGERKGYSGVSILSKVKPKEVQTHFGDNNILSNEGRTILARYENFTLINAYFPNGKSREERLVYKMDYYDAFLTLAKELRSKGETVIFCGDINTAHTEIDLARPKPNKKTSGFLPMEREWIDDVISSNFTDTFRMFNSDPEQYSWWDQKTRARDRNVGWRIDYFFVDSKIEKKVSSAFIMTDVMGSDHAPVGIEIDV